MSRVYAYNYVCMCIICRSKSQLYNKICRQTFLIALILTEYEIAICKFGFCVYIIKISTNKFNLNKILLFGIFN